MRTLCKITALLALIAFGAAGCGVRGSLDPPPEGAIDNVERTGSGGTGPDGEKHHDSFVLDGLIR